MTKGLYKLWARGVGGNRVAYGINVPKHVSETFDIEEDRFVCSREGNSIVFKLVKVEEV